MRHAALFECASALIPPPLFNTLQDTAVRDLAWVIASPSLLQADYPAYQGRVVDDAWCATEFQRGFDWLCALDLDPLTLHQFIAARPTRRLGHYFETLIAFWLTHMPDTHIIATNLQVQNKERTQGEYDFLFRHASLGVCHWEAAVKFYLQVEDSTEQCAFIGPGNRDRLDLKINRVFNHQLLLAQTEAGQHALPQQVKLDKAQAFIKGYLFYHASTLGNKDIQGVSAAHLRGWWVRHSLEKVPQNCATSRWIILPRLGWLAPARVAENTQMMDEAALAEHLTLHFTEHSDAVLVFEMARSDTGDYLEISRGFVVGKSWPNMDLHPT